MKNLISVIMPYFNKKKYIKSSVESILIQSNQNFEIIIIYDDPSQKDFEYILEIQKLDSRINVIKNNNNLIDSLMLQDQIFQTRLNMFQNELNTDIIILNVISAYNFIALLIIIVFIMVIRNFR